jgi:thymidylate synthase (FAD)
MSANVREWRHFFRLRAAKAAHPQMQEVAIPLLIELQEKTPVIFDDIPWNTAFTQIIKY